MPQPASGTDVLPESGEAVITISDGLTFPLDVGDLGQFKLGEGRVSTPDLPLGGSGFTAQVTVGAHNGLALGNTRLQVTPMRVGISATEIAQKKKEKDDAISAMGIAGAATGGLVGGVAGSGLLGPLPALALGGPFGGAEKGGILGGQVGEGAGRAVMADQVFKARLVEGAVEAHFPLVYQPFFRLNVSYEVANLFLQGWGELQTSLELDFAPALRLDRGTEIALHFENGRFSKASFTLALTGALGLKLSGAGRLSAGLTILPKVGEGASKDSPGLLDLPLFHSGVFALFDPLETSFEATTMMDFATGSALKSTKHSELKANPKSGMSFEQRLFELLTKEAMGQQFADAREESKKIRKGEEDPDDWHTGAEDDPIPITYYKPLEAFVDSFQVRKGARFITLTNWPHREYEMREADEVIPDGKEHTWKVGVHEKNVPHTRMKLIRTSGTGRANADAWKEQAKEFGLDLGGLQVDHVKDLGLGGEDAFDNLWPITEADNQQAGRLMYDQPVKWRDPKARAGIPLGATKLGAVPGDGTIHLVVRHVQKGASG